MRIWQQRNRELCIVYQSLGLYGAIRGLDELPNGELTSDATVNGPSDIADQFDASPAAIWSSRIMLAALS